MPFKTQLVATSSSTGTGTTKTQLNAAADLIIPAAVTALHSFTPYQAATGAYTAAQSSQQLIELESSDIQPNISPKAYVMDPTSGGLSTFDIAAVALLRDVPINVPCIGGNRLRVYGTAREANTVAFRVGVGFTISDTRPDGPQMFWDAGAATSAGTAAARVTGGNITVSAGTRVKKVYGRVSVTGTVTASESFVGYFEFVSNGFVDAIPCTFPAQPMGVGLGSLVAPLLPGGQDWNVDIGLRNPGTGQVTVNTYYNQEEAQTAAQIFDTGLGYIR